MAAHSLDYIPTALTSAIAESELLSVKGRVSHVIGTIIRAVVPAVKGGELCMLGNPAEEFELAAEVVGFVKDAALLTPIGDMHGIPPTTGVIPTGRPHMVPVGPSLLGRVLDGMGRPLDSATKGRLTPVVSRVRARTATNWGMLWIGLAKPRPASRRRARAMSIVVEEARDDLSPAEHDGMARRQRRARMVQQGDRSGFEAGGGEHRDERVDDRYAQLIFWSVPRSESPSDFRTVV